MKAGSSGGLPDYLESLNKEQQAAVLHEGGNLLILAGAGSGKTRVITTKIAYLIRERGIAPESILAVTFTNKAAAEMRERACAIEPLCERANLRTFHSFGAWFLRRNAQSAGLDKNFTIYDDDDSTTLARAAFPGMNRQDARKLAQAFARAKDYNLSPDSPDLDDLFEDYDDFSRDYFEYERRLRATGNVDFGDLISMPTRILENDATVRERTHARFRVIMVDEYQDSNVAQFALLKALAGPGAYVCVVGDDDQSIYRFRGAEVRNILEFPDIFPDTSVVKLERNYRSYQAILDVASAVVENNQDRLGKTLRAERKGGEKPVLAVLQDNDEEASYCVRLIDRHIRGGGSFADIAILYRTNAQSLLFERALPRAGIPYRLVGALRFYEREEVKDALALLALACNQRDEVAFRRIANKPTRGIGNSSLELVVEKAFSGDGNLLDAAQDTKLKAARSRNGLAEFSEVMKKILREVSPAWEEAQTDAYALDGMELLNKRNREVPNPEESLARVAELAIKESGLLEYHRNQDEIAGSQKVANLDELINAASDYPATRDGLSEFLEAVELDRAMSSKEVSLDAVTLITMHNTKGLEFPLVVITGMEQGLFPRDEDEDEDLEEQRRLLYVAMTRAKDELHLTYCRRRLFHGRVIENPPSIFLAEIPQEAIKIFGGKLDLGAVKGLAGWKIGTAVYHDDHGSGQIIKTASTDESGPCVTVHFETGRTMKFFPKFTSKLEILGD